MIIINYLTKNFKMLIIKIINYIFLKLYSKIKPISYAKFIGVKLGKNVFIYGNAMSMFGTEPWAITIGNNVHITREVIFITHDGGTLLFRDRMQDLEITSPIKIGNNVYIGVRSLILPGVIIGNNCIIAAGSIVTKNIPDNSVYGGNPAKFIISFESYFESLKSRSLNLGHVKGRRKDYELKKYFNKI